MLTIIGAHRSASGDYLVSASNARGKRDLFFAIDVTFPPEFISVTSGQNDVISGGKKRGDGDNDDGANAASSSSSSSSGRNKPIGGGGGDDDENDAKSKEDVFHAVEGGNVTLACKARANPATREMLQWKPPRDARGVRGVVDAALDERSAWC